MGIRLDIEVNMNKMEEAKVLNKLRDAFKGTGNYLEELFTNEFVEWAKSNVKNDIMPDAMQYIDPTDRLKDREEIASLKAEVKSQVDMMKLMYEDANERIDALNVREKIICELKDEVASLGYELSRCSRERNEQADRYSSELTELKARLYDLIG